MKNWKTTLTGAVIGGLYVALTTIQSGSFTWANVGLGFGIFVLGALSKDFDVTGGAR